MRSAKSTLDSGFVWDTARVKLAGRLCEAGVRRVMSRVGCDDEYAVGELSAEATSSVWLHVDEEWWELGEASDSSDNVVRLASWRAVRAVFDGRWLAGRILDSRSLRGVLGRSGGKCWESVEAGARAAPYLSVERVDSFLRAVRDAWRVEFGARGVVLAGLVMEGASVRECARRTRRNVWEVRCERAGIVAVAERIAQVHGEWVVGCGSCGSTG